MPCWVPAWVSLWWFISIPITIGMFAKQSSGVNKIKIFNIIGKKNQWFKYSLLFY